ncbi:MAG: hypothetical protein PHU08_00165 [Dehalococcoidales bacterium]|nr:hypothetical protein [Dehalococcoidales bacterium]
MLEELQQLIKEATASVEAQLSLEDAGWIKLGGTGTDVLTGADRIEQVKRSRIYAAKDPLAKQALRLWTDYTFGTGMSWRTDEESVSKLLSTYWDSKDNAPVLSARGQRKNSDKLLIDGEIFFAVFLGSQGQATIRTVDPMEITEIITNPDDIEDVKYYKREWATPQSVQKVGYYRSFRNEKDEATPDSTGTSRQSTEDAFIYHLTYNTTGQRGLPLLLPALDWIKLYRQFLASRVAVMLALARFAWKAKVQGGAAAVASAKAVYNEQTPAAGSVAIENMGADLQPIKTDSGASQAYQDGRMIKLQVAAATGWPEQYFGDVSTGNLATAKTVELPVKKMCESYQAVWAGAYDDIDQFVLEHNNIPEDKRYIDRDFPAISPEDAGEIAASIAAIMPYFPQFAESPDVLQQALMAVGVHDTNDALEALSKVAKESSSDVNVELAKALRQFREVIESGNVSGLRRVKVSGVRGGTDSLALPEVQGNGTN